MSIAKRITATMAAGTMLFTGTMSSGFVTSAEENTEQSYIYDNYAEESYLPAIQDDTGTITEEMKEVIWAKYEEKYPDTDCSDFTLIYSEEKSVFAASGTNYYGFLPYYKDTILIDLIPRITVTADGEMTATVIEETYVNYCLSLNDFYLSKAEIMEYVCYEADSHLLAENLQSVSLIVDNFYGYGIALAYELVYVYADSNCHRTFYLNAYTGLGMYYINDWDDGLQYGWTGMLRLSCTVENDAYLFAVQGPYKSREVYLADAEAGETLGTMTSDDTSDTAPYTCTYSLALDADEGMRTVYAYVNHTGSFLNTKQEVSNYVTLSANGTSTETTVATETTTFTLGDVDENNIIDAIGASYILSEYAKKATSQASGFTESQELAADVNGDSVVDAVDASFILSYYAYTAVGGTDSFEDYMTTH